MQNLVSQFFGNKLLPAFIYSVTRFPFSKEYPFDVARSSQFFQSSYASGFPRNKASSSEFGFVPKVQWESPKLITYRSSAKIEILIAESEHCLFASSLSNRVHEIRFFIPLINKISSEVFTAQ